MDPLNDEEKENMRRKGLIAFYIKHQTMFDNLGRQIYVELEKTGNSKPPTRREVFVILKNRVRISPAFKKHMGKIDPHLKTGLYPGFAGLLARHIIEQSWSKISNKP